MEYKQLLGKVIYKQSCYAAPDVMQIVGWPKNIEKLKRKVVFVRKIDILKPTVCTGLVDGGGGTIELSWVDTVMDPTTTCLSDLTKFTVTMEDGEYYFKESGVKQIGYFSWSMLEKDRSYSYCDY